jgi:hypothetical protein
MICSLVTRSNRLDVQGLASGSIILLTNTPPLERRPSSPIWPRLRFVKLTSTRQFKLRGNR